MKAYDDKVLAGLIPHPADDAFKYSRGRLTLVAGSAAYPGAAALAAMASMRVGSGYTEAFVEDEVVPEVRAMQPSLVVRPWALADNQRVPASTAEKPCAYVVGCGFDVDDPFAAAVTRRLLRYADAPLLVDGGALRLLSAKKMRDMCERRFRHGQTTIVTPHGGEARTLASIFDLAVDDPENLAFNLSRAYGVLCVLKGPDTFISDGEDTYAMTEGTAALAKAGTGDVLAGVIGGLLAQGLDAVDASVLGTTLHARAGRLAAERLGDVSVIAEDVIESLPAAILETQRACR